MAAALVVLVVLLVCPAHSVRSPQEAKEILKKKWENYLNEREGNRVSDDATPKERKGLLARRVEEAEKRSKERLKKLQERLSQPQQQEPDIAGYLPGVVDLRPDEVIGSTSDGRAWLVAFVAPWCVHCQQLAPVLADVGKAIGEGHRDFAVGKVDATQPGSSPLLAALNIEGYPTVMRFHNGEHTAHTGERTADSLLAFLKKTLIKQPRREINPDAVMTGVKELTPNSVLEVIDDGRGWLVFFYSDCALSKATAPLWASLGLIVAVDGAVGIAKMKANDVSVVLDGRSVQLTKKVDNDAALPTIVYIPPASAAKAAVVFDGERTVKALLQFLKEHGETVEVPSELADLTDPDTTQGIASMSTEILTSFKKKLGSAWRRAGGGPGLRERLARQWKELDKTE